ncbi:factor H binding protein domain-containing protein [Actinobacillus porcinus]|uniref:factor H binding protein domain-containing protein n=1 Tax=Actinobacillus porcinus TaxID=51048 RepID=UPI0023545DF7|nr:factor H binding protein domain-containing protein [Actinobacillus porcinus]
MRLSVKTAAMAILVSLGVTACSSGGGGGGSSAPTNNPEQAKQIEALKKQVEVEQQAVKSAQNSANEATEKVKAVEAAKAKAEDELVKAQQALKNIETANATEKAKAQAAADKAAKDLAEANKALEAAKAETLAEQAKAQVAAEQAAKDLATANKALEAAKAETLAEQAKAQAAAEQAAKDLATANKALEAAKAETLAEQAKAQAAAEQAAKDLATANKAVEAAKAETLTEQAKAQAAADKAAKDLATANKALEAAKAETLAEQAKAQTAAEQAAKDLATANKALEVAKAETLAEQEKAQQDVEKAKAELAKLQEKQLYLDSTWRYLGGYDTASQRATIGRSLVKIDLSKYPESDDVRQIDVVNDDGINVGKAYFINQAYSSYEQFIPDDVSSQTYYSGNDFVFIPTDAAKSSAIQNRIRATYTGLALDRNYNNDTDSSGSVTKAKFSLTADFAQNTVEGAITERENGRADIQLEQGVISSPVTNQYINMPYMGFSGVAKTTRKSGAIRTGEYIGFFAGPNAEEVVGSVNNLGGLTSFGGKRQ